MTELHRRALDFILAFWAERVSVAEGVGVCVGDAVILGVGVGVCVSVAEEVS